MRMPIALIPCLLLACGAGQDVAMERDRLASELADTQAANARLERENDALHGQLRAAQTEADRLTVAWARATLGLGAGEALGATFKTSMGDIHCTLRPDEAPNTVINFVQLAEGTRPWTDKASGETVTRPLYTGTIFHRVLPKFMIQGGDPEGTGAGGPGFTFADETSAEDAFDRPGLLAMANRGPNTNGSQFFITDRAKPAHLNGKHTIFGSCEDLDVVKAIATVDRDRQDRPAKDVKLQRVVVQRGD
jgi:peptidyl-prolyl cis-trans isomerase A (cyclophilin A)